MGGVAKREGCLSTHVWSSVDSKERVKGEREHEFPKGGRRTRQRRGNGDERVWDTEHRAWASLTRSLVHSVTRRHAAKLFPRLESRTLICPVPIGHFYLL